MEANQNFKTACNLLGWGDPSGGLWFVGIEEAQAWTPDLISKYTASGSPQFILETKSNWKDLGYSGKSIRDYTCKIVQPVSQKYKDKTWQEYRDELLWKQGSVFQANYYPLGKPKLNQWPLEYQELFGLKSTDKKSYCNLVKELRVPLLLKLWGQHTPKATICFGVYAWNEFKNLFSLSSDCTWLDEDVAAYPDKKIILSPFLGQGMSDKKAELIKNQLQEWQVALV